MIISVLGCGWLGLPLARELVDSGHRVKGSTTRAEVREHISAAGAAPYCFRVKPPFDGEVGDFFACDVLFLNIPPGRSDPGKLERYEDQIRAVAGAASAEGVPWIVFASSTSVYPDLNRAVSESDAHAAGPRRRSGEVLLQTEAYLKQDQRFAVTILRFAGLYGYDRQPGRFLSGKAATGGAAPVNLVHRDDAVAAVKAVLHADAHGGTYNVCADEHPTREALYRAKAREIGVPEPEFRAPQLDGYKLVRNDHLKRDLGFVFRHPDPLLPAP